MARTEFDVLEGGPVATTEELVRAMEAVHEVHVSETFTDHVVEIVKRTRTHPAHRAGGQPPRRDRAGQGLAGPGPDPRPQLRRSPKTCSPWPRT